MLTEVIKTFMVTFLHFLRLMYTYSYSKGIILTQIVLKMKFIIGTLLCLSLTSTKSEKKSLTLHFENIKNTQGALLVGIYKDETSWKLRKPAKEFVIAKTDLQYGSFKFTLDDLEPGRYGVAVLDDVNANEIVDMGVIFPKEGFGFSNYYHSSFLLPKFENFMFDFPAKETVTIKFRYLNL